MKPFSRKFLLAGLLSMTAITGAFSQDKEKVSGQKYALLVGVRQYDKTELEPLPFTESDVRDLATVLRDSGYDHVILLTQTIGAEETRYLPTAANIRKEMQLLLAELTEQDSILIALAGHGVEYRGNEEVFFCPADAKPSTKENLVPFSEVYKELENCQAGFKLLLVDACRKDPLANATRRATVAIESVTRPQRKVPPGGVAALFSCSSGEFAHESKTLKHGVFFHFVIEGLRGSADLDGDKKITLPELELYTKKQVPAKVREEFANRQMPDLIGKTRGLTPLTTVETSDSLAEQGKELLDKQEYERAIRRFDAALRKDPKNWWAYFHRGYAHLERGNNDDAIADYTESLKINPDDAASYNNRALAHYHKEEYDLAVADCTRAIRLEPKEPLYLRNRGNAYRDRGDLDLALADYDAAHVLAPEDIDVLIDRGYVHQLKKSHEAAPSDYSKAISLKPDSALAYSKRAALHLELEDFDKAIADYTQAIRLDPDNAEHYQNRGWIYYHKKDDYTKALADHNIWLRLDPEAIEAMRVKAGCLVRLGKPEEAIRVVDEAIQRDAEDVYSVAVKGEVLYYAGKRDEAIKFFEKSTAMWAKRAELSDDERESFRQNRHSLALIHSEKKDLASAEPILRELMKEAAENPEYLNDLAYCMLENDATPAQAERLVRRAMSLYREKQRKEGKPGEEADPYHVANLGWALYKQGKTEQGLEQMERVASEKKLQQVVYLSILGDVRLAAGKKPEAIAAWKKAIEVAMPHVPDQQRKAEVEKKLREVK